MANRRCTILTYGRMPKCTHVTHFKTISILIFGVCVSSLCKHTLCFANVMLFFKPVLTPRIQPSIIYRVITPPPLVGNLTDPLFLSKSHELIEKRTPDELARPDAL